MISLSKIQLKMLIRLKPNQRLYFAPIGGGFAYEINSSPGNFIVGRCIFRNESRFWEFHIEALCNRKLDAVILSFNLNHATEFEVYLKKVGHPFSINT